MTDRPFAGQTGRNAFHRQRQAMISSWRWQIVTGRGTRGQSPDGAGRGPDEDLRPVGLSQMGSKRGVAGPMGTAAVSVSQ